VLNDLLFFQVLDGVLVAAADAMECKEAVLGPS
jgi:hypothetical protein